MPVHFNAYAIGTREGTGHLPYEIDLGVLDQNAQFDGLPRQRSRGNPTLHAAAALLQSRGEPPPIDDSFKILVNCQSDTSVTRVRAF